MYTYPHHHSAQHTLRRCVAMVRTKYLRRLPTPKFFARLVSVPVPVPASGLHCLSGPASARPAPAADTRSRRRQGNQSPILSGTKYRTAAHSPFSSLELGGPGGGRGRHRHNWLVGHTVRGWEEAWGELGRPGTKLQLRPGPKRKKTGHGRLWPLVGRHGRSDSHSR